MLIFIVLITMHSFRMATLGLPWTVLRSDPNLQFRRD